MLIPTIAFAIIAADVNRDGIVNMMDGLQVLSTNHYDRSKDVNSDGVVDHRDFLAVLEVFRAGWGVHDTGDRRPWIIMPGEAKRVGPSPFPGRRRLTFLDDRGYEVAIDFVALGTQAVQTPEADQSP